ncbi:hypothetical protein [Hydrogenophaga sp. BPS33]|uniref:hypothetical protein n=1 Tax=Hydrogenophaga sp. BPS33 TaxID=2651974 RepID=UPI00131F7029|nr:hypothetical protein [Hydrogenophaga sp. BPS33]QHE87597.1 hypothetical protein F9K07_23215 [Hydrogenophaga sp. BPS33]
MDGSTGSSSESPRSVDPTPRVTRSNQVSAHNPAHNGQGPWNALESINDMYLGPDPEPEPETNAIAQTPFETRIETTTDIDSSVSPPRFVPPHSSSAEGLDTSAPALPQVTPPLASTPPPVDLFAQLKSIRVQVPQLPANSALAPRASALQQHLDHLATVRPPFCCPNRYLALIGVALGAMSVAVYFGIQPGSNERYAAIAPLLLALAFITQAAMRHYLARLLPTE